jgi:hypothetical protein
MSDPGKIDLGDWLTAIVTSMIAGIGGAMAWFGNAKNKLNLRMDGIDTRLDEIIDVSQQRHQEQAIALNTLQLNQSHANQRMEEIKQEIRMSAEDGAERVRQQMESVLMEIRKNKL